jgi:predicted restriction endonuclease
MENVLMKTRGMKMQGSEEYKKKKREYQKQRRLNPEIAEKEREYSKNYSRRNKDIMIIRRKKRSANLRNTVLEHYGGKCACCGEVQNEFLSIDHVNNDGAIERKEKHLRGPNLYSYIIKNGFPNSYRVLCYNCNMSLGMHGYCPHNVIVPSDGSTPILFTPNAN